MIKCYAYYNHGGYKDFYVGNLEEEAKSKYFLPLLAVHELSLSENPGDEELKRQVERQHRLPKLIALSDTTPECNYPYEARILMSHGGYKVLYKRLNPFSYALAVRDIAGPKDVYGRQSPFNMMFIGEKEDIRDMDIVAGHIRHDITAFEDLLSGIFVNDLTENGLRCDVGRLNAAMRDIIGNGPTQQSDLQTALPVRLLIVSNCCNLDSTFKEQNLNRAQVNVCYGEDGCLVFKADARPSSKNAAVSNRTDGRDACRQREDEAEKRPNLSLHAMLNTPKLEDIEKIWACIRELEKENIRLSMRIEELERKLVELENKI